MKCSMTSNICNASRVESHSIDNAEVDNVFENSVRSVEKVGNILDKLVGSCPVVSCKLAGIPVKMLVDSGSMVTTISESFFNEHLRGRVDNPVDSSRFLKLRAANGLECPYSGYVILDLEILGQVITKGVLVQKDDPKSYDGLLGTNFLDELEGFKAWKKSLQQKEHVTMIDGSSVKLAGANQVRIPAESVVDVKVTGPSNRNWLLVEALDQPIKGSIAAMATLVNPEDGDYLVRLVNVSKGDVWLKPGTMVGKAHSIDYVVNKLLDVEENEGELIVGEVTRMTPYVACNSVSPAISPSPQQGEDLLSKVSCSTQLSSGQRKQLGSLLEEFRDVFAEDDDDLGCTPSAVHEIKLEDDKPVRVPYRRIPPAYIQEVKDHLQKLLQQGVIRESQSPYSSAVVLVRKKSGALRLCVDYRLLNRKSVKQAFPLP